MMRLATLLGWSLVLGSLGLSGCSALNWGASKEPVVAGPMSQITLELRAAKKEPKVSSLEIPADATVQQVLDKSGAKNKFSRLSVELYRQTPGGQWHKMKVECDPVKKRVDPLYDYHVRSGDRLIVSEDTSDMLDDMMKSNIGPLGGLLGK